MEKACEPLAWRAGGQVPPNLQRGSQEPQFTWPSQAHRMDAGPSDANQVRCGTASGSSDWMVTRERTALGH